MRLLLILLLIPFVYAEVSLTLNQSEYYFLTGQDAIIPLELNSTELVKGTLRYTVTQEVSQGNTVYQSSNSQSVSYTIEEGFTVASLDFQTSDSPARYDIKIDYRYDDKVVDLEQFSIFFVKQDSEKQQSEETTESQESTKPPPPTPEQKQQQKLQNSQLSQDTKSLKQEMQERLRQTEEKEAEFEKNLMENEEFLQKQQELLDKGFEPTENNFRPTANDSGTFNMGYERNGTKANIKGEMNEGEIEEISSEIEADQEDMLEQFYEDQRFKDHEEKLLDKGYSRDNISISGTQVTQEYSFQNRTAEIIGEFENETLDKVLLREPFDWSWLPWLTVVLLGMLFFLTRKKPIKIQERPFDYRKESRNLLTESKQLFENKRFKDAYGKASESIRLYLSYKHGVKKELTSTETVLLLRKSKEPFKDVRDCLNLCGQVEFAKYRPNKKDFNKIIQQAEKIIKY